MIAPRRRDRGDLAHETFKVVQDFARRIAQRTDTTRGEPLIPRSVTRGTISALVGLTVDLDR